MPVKRRIYLDHNASMPMLAEARAAAIDAMDAAGNPSSVHAEGRRARALIEDARAAVAELVGAEPDAVIFISGASEAAATCLQPRWTDGLRPRDQRHLLVCATDHPCVRGAGTGFDAAAGLMPVDASGRFAPGALDDVMQASGHGALPMLALTLANGETGVVADTADEALRRYAERGTVVVDAVQAAGRMPIAIRGLPCAALILSGHKLGAMTGVGAIVLADPAVRPAPLIVGGAQEDGRRAGTEAVAAIASFGAAATVARRRLAEGTERMLAMRQRLEKDVERHPAVRIVARDAPRLPNTVAIVVDGVAATSVQMALDIDGFAVSAGSACMSGKVGPSAVLTAMAAAGAPFDPSPGAIRVSFGFDTEEEDLRAFADAFHRAAGRMSAVGGRRAA